MDRTMKYIFACGGTGGHIFPAFSVAEELKRRDPASEILYVCGKLDIENEIFKMVLGERVLSVESAPFTGGRSLLSPHFLIKLTKGFAFAVNLLKRERPDAVVGFGGYFSFPVLLAARMRGIPCLVHEQNVVPGVANRILGPYVDGMALSFTETKGYFKSSVKTRLTGNPVRLSIERGAGREEALKFFGFEKNRKTVLILGGSQGAESINTLFLNALGYFGETFKKNIQVLHLCGRMSPESAQKTIREAGVYAKAFSFFDRMDLVYAVTDLAVGRAGATFLAEISTKNIPAILIPYPFGSGHQKLNATVFSQMHQAIVLVQAGLTAEKMAWHIEGLARENSGSVPRNGASSDTRPNARELLADFIMETASKNAKP